MYEQLLYQEKFNQKQKAASAYQETANNFFLMEEDVKKKKKTYYSLKQLLNECPFYGLEAFGENYIC